MKKEREWKRYRKWKGWQKIVATPELYDTVYKTSLRICYLYTHVSGKMRPVESIPGVGGGKIKETDGGGESNYDTW
jgi:hypothetical protein